MDKFIHELILFIITFLIVFLLYRLLVVRRAKSKKKAKEPREVTYLVYRYKLDLNNRFSFNANGDLKEARILHSDIVSMLMWYSWNSICLVL